jgi:hypothetical protein
MDGINICYASKATPIAKKHDSAKRQPSRKSMAAPKKRIEAIPV